LNRTIKVQKDHY